MIEITLLFFNYGLSVVFGFFFAASLLSKGQRKGEFIHLLLIGLCLSSLQIITTIIWDSTFTMKAFPLITHLPLIIILMLYYKCNLLICTSAVCTSYMCCIVPRWFGSAILELTDNKIAAYSARAAVMILVAIAMFKLLSAPISEVLASPGRISTIFSIVPITFYIFNYATTVYTKILYSSNALVAEFPLFFVSLVYLCSVLLYMSEYRHRQEAEHSSQQLIIQLNSYEHLTQRIEDTRKANHNLRQHLRLIQSYLDTGNTAALQDYINKYGLTLPPVTGTHFCENSTADLVIRFYADQAASLGIMFTASTTISSDIRISDPDLCVVLGNLLENALDCCKEHIDDAPAIKLTASVAAGMLVMTIDNAPADKPNVLNGVLRSTKLYGSGIGTKSVTEIAERYDGETRYEWKNGTFMASVIMKL